MIALNNGVRLSGNWRHDCMLSSRKAVSSRTISTTGRNITGRTIESQYTLLRSSSWMPRPFFLGDPEINNDRRFLNERFLTGELKRISPVQKTKILSISDHACPSGKRNKSLGNFWLPNCLTELSTVQGPRETKMAVAILTPPSVQNDNFRFYSYRNFRQLEKRKSFVWSERAKTATAIFVSLGPELLIIR